MTKLSITLLLLSLFLTSCRVPTSKSSSQTSSSSITFSSSVSDSESSITEDPESDTTHSPEVTPVDEVASIGNMRYLVSHQSQAKSLGNYQANGTYLILIIGAKTMVPKPSSSIQLPSKSLIMVPLIQRVHSSRFLQIKPTMVQLTTLFF